MSRYNIFQSLTMSFYSKKIYKDVANNWGVKAFLYLLMLSLISAISILVILHKYYNQNIPNITKQMPTLIFQHGKLSTPEYRPYYIISPLYKNKPYLIVIDTTGKFTSPLQAHAKILITKKEMVFDDSWDDLNDRDLDGYLKLLSINPNATIDSEQITQKLDDVFFFIQFILAFFLILFIPCIMIITVLLCALIGKIFSGIANIKLTYWQITRIAIVSLTPVTVISFIPGFMLIDINDFISLPIALFISLFYFYYGIVANK